MAQQKKRGPGRPKGSKNKKTPQPVTPKTKEERIKDMQDQRHADRKVIDEIWAITVIALGIMFFFTIFLDTTGAFGQKVHDICLGLFGFMAYVLPFLLILSGVLLFAQKLQHINARTVLFSVLIFINICLLNSYRFIDESNLHFSFVDIAEYYLDAEQGQGGGALGMELGTLLVKFFGKPGLLIIAISLIIISLLLVVNTPMSNGIVKIKNKREEKRILSELDKAEAKKLENAQMAAASIPQAPIIDKPIEKPIINNPVSTDAEEVKIADVAPKKKSFWTGIFDRPVNTTPQSNAPSLPTIDEEKKKEMFDLFKATDNFSTPQENLINESPRYNDEEDDWIGRPGKSKSFGLDGIVPKRTGFGLDGYDSMDFSTPMQAAAVGSVVGVATKTSEYRPAGTNSSEKRKKSLKDATPIAATAAAVGAVKDDINTDDVAADLNSGFNASADNDSYKLPPTSILKKGSSSKQMMTDYQLEQRAELLHQTLANFGVEAKVLSVTQGASVTRYEVQPATGVKVSKITSLADDIALNLRAKSIRIEAPIPGKAAVGIEVENNKPAPIFIRELIESPEFQDSKSKISFVVGKDISGNNIVSDLKGMPHLLIAGTTGSGKSVCINSIIASFLYKAKPSELKLIMIDPKVVELGNYNGIPHLLTSVVTDPRKAARALGEAVAEMNKRYDEFAKMGVKDLDSYNELMRANMEPQNCKPEVVIIIDELADLMMASPTQVEESICRLAQKARAAGMHLIVATQRPSVDVVTGLIKANIPSRIAFSVSSQIDSRTILDMAGAEKLLGKGDMLFSPVGSSKPYRVQGPYISDTETAKLIDFVKRQGQAEYDEELSNAIEGNAESKTDAPQDDLTEDAIAFILKSKQASVSMLQRRFRIGYNRAARIIDEIEALGVIGPSDGSRPRQVLVTEEEYYGGGTEDGIIYVEEEDIEVE